MTKLTKLTKLTKKEIKFLKYFLEDNGCGANTACELQMDNFSCQNVEDLSEYQELSPQAVGAYLGSLIQKNVIRKQEGPLDLFFIDEAFLELLRLDGQGMTPFDKLKL